MNTPKEDFLGTPAVEAVMATAQSLNFAPMTLSDNGIFAFRTG